MGSIPATTHFTSGSLVESHRSRLSSERNKRHILQSQLPSIVLRLVTINPSKGIRHPRSWPQHLPRFDGHGLRRLRSLVHRRKADGLVSAHATLGKAVTGAIELAGESLVELHTSLPDYRIPGARLRRKCLACVQSDKHPGFAD